MKIYWEHDGEHIGNLINMLEFDGNNTIGTTKI
jgi:hypothetical protein